MEGIDVDDIVGILKYPLIVRELARNITKSWFTETFGAAIRF